MVSTCEQRDVVKNLFINKECFCSTVIYDVLFKINTKRYFNKTLSSIDYETSNAFKVFPACKC